MSKLLIVIPTLDRSGAEKQFCQLALGLTGRGHDVEVVALTRGGPYESVLAEGQVPVTVLHKRYRFDVQTVFQLRRFIRDRKPDVVVSALFAANTAVRLATYHLRPCRPRVIVSERCVDSWKSGWQMWLDRTLQPYCDWIVANSESVAQFYREQGISAQKLVVIPNSVETPAAPGVSRQELCEQLQIPPHAKLIGYVGRLARQKRISDLLWSIQMLRHSRPDAFLLILGDGPLRDELLEQARRVEAEPHTRFLGHRVDAASLMHHFDLFWLASEFEGMSNSLMEAMACGLPCVVSDIPANRELVDHGTDGWIVNMGDSAGFTQYALQLLEDEQLAKRMGAAAQQKVLAEFSPDAMLDRYEQLLARPDDEEPHPQ